MSKKNENNAIVSALQSKLGYDDVSTFELLNSEAPNSCAILDKKTSQVWKIARNRPKTNPRLELRALEALPDGCADIVKHIDSGELQVSGTDHFYLVFPYIEGSSLRITIKNRVEAKTPFALSEIKKIGDLVTQAICFLNDRQIIHQDIKPDNIIIKPDGSAVLIDLGIALFIQDSPKDLKKLEGPYAYMSPEKLGVIGNGKFRQWAKLNFTSDLFSLGLILLEMATLRKVNGDLEPNLANLYKIGQIVPDLEIDENLKKYLIPFLQTSQYDRQKTVLDITKCAILQQVEAKDYRFWLHSSSKSVSIVDSFLEEHTFKSKFGLIYKAEQASSEKNILDIEKRGMAVITKGGEFALDPCTYLQALDGDHHRGTKYFSYGGKFDVGQVLYPPKFAPDGYLKNYVKGVIDAQTNIGGTSYISPYLYLDSIESENAEANFMLWQETNKYINNQEIQKDIYYGLLISERLILARAELMELAMAVTNQRYTKKIYLRVESRRPQSQPMWDKIFMENLRDFITFISQTNIILLAGVGVEGIGFLSYGITEVSTNPFFSQRKFSLEDKLSKRDGGVEPAPRYFARNLLNEVLVPQEIDTPLISNPALGNIFTCGCSFCPNRDKESLAKHLLTQFDDMFNIVAAGIGLGTSQAEFLRWLDVAGANYNTLETSGIQLSAPTGGSFIPVWKRVFSQ